MRRWGYWSARLWLILVLTFVALSFSMGAPLWIYLIDFLWTIPLSISNVWMTRNWRHSPVLAPKR